MIDAKTYNLPPIVHAALMTRRTELLEQIDVSTLRHQDVRALLSLLADLIDDQRKAVQKENEDKAIVEEALRAIRGHINKVELVLTGRDPADREDEDF